MQKWSILVWGKPFLTNLLLKCTLITVGLAVPVMLMQLIHLVPGGSDMRHHSLMKCSAPVWYKVIISINTVLSFESCALSNKPQESSLNIQIFAFMKTTLKYTSKIVNPLFIQTSTRYLFHVYIYIYIINVLLVLYCMVYHHIWYSHSKFPRFLARFCGTFQHCQSTELWNYDRAKLKSIASDYLVNSVETESSFGDDLIWVLFMHETGRILSLDYHWYWLDTLFSLCDTKFVEVSSFRLLIAQPSFQQKYKVVNLCVFLEIQFR